MHMCRCILFRPHDPKPNYPLSPVPRCCQAAARAVTSRADGGEQSGAELLEEPRVAWLGLTLGLGLGLGLKSHGSPLLRVRVRVRVRVEEPRVASAQLQP